MHRPPKSQRKLLGRTKQQVQQRLMHPMLPSIQEQFEFQPIKYSSRCQTAPHQTAPIFRAGIMAQFGSGTLQNCAATCQTGLFALLFKWLKAKENSNVVLIFSVRFRHFSETI